MTISPTITTKPYITTGTSSPVGSVTPIAVGHKFINTTNDVIYMAAGTTSADWKTLTPESGTATLTPRFGGSTTGITTSTSEMRWWRKDELVHFSVSIVFTNRGSFSSSDLFDAQGVPFTPDGNHYFPLRVGNMGSLIGDQAIVGRLVSGSDDIFLEQIDGSAARLDWADFADNTSIAFNGSYVTSD